MSNGPKRKTYGPPKSAGYEDAARTTPTGYDPPEFTSDAAEERWDDLGRPSLLGSEPSGKNGYTVADVEAAAEEEG